MSIFHENFSSIAEFSANLAYFGASSARISHPTTMLRTLSFTNFCSFRDPAELSLTASAKTPVDHSYTTSRCGDHITVLCGVFGPNASGKTNLLKVLAFLNFFARHSYRSLGPATPIPVDPFLDGNTNPVRILAEFEGHGRLYRYETLITPAGVEEERLSQRFDDTRSFRTLLHRRAGKSGPLLGQHDEFTDLDALRGLLKDRPNASMLSAGLVTGRPEFNRIFESLGRVETNVDRMGKAEIHQSTRASDVIACARYFQENPHFKNDLEDRLKRADLGIDAFSIRELEMADSETGKVNRIPVPFVTHKSGGKSFEIPLTMESSGTKRLFLLLGTFLPVLTEGGIAVIDEMESDLHPHIIPLLIDLFVDAATNPKRAQLVFTCHHVEILNQLAKEQIILVQKDTDNVSSLRRLADIPGVRREENFFANYNAGRYEAVPSPSLF